MRWANYRGSSVKQREAAEWREQKNCNHTGTQRKATIYVSSFFFKKYHLFSVLLNIDYYSCCSTTSPLNERKLHGQRGNMSQSFTINLYWLRFTSVWLLHTPNVNPAHDPKCQNILNQILTKRGRLSSATLKKWDHFQQGKQVLPRRLYRLLLFVSPGAARHQHVFIAVHQLNFLAFDYRGP